MIDREFLELFGQGQLNQIEDASTVDISGLIETIRAEELKPDAERGSLSLEKEKRLRAVDGYVYAAYRRAQVDQRGTGIAHGLIDVIGTPRQEPPRELFFSLRQERRDSYKKKMNKDPAAMLDDIRGYLGAMEPKDFLWIKNFVGITPEGVNPFIYAYIFVLGVIEEGLLSLWDITPDHQLNDAENALTDAIKAAAAKVTGLEPIDSKLTTFKFDALPGVDRQPEPGVNKETSAPEIKTRQISRAFYPIDILNYKAWGGLKRAKEKEIDGQVTFDYDGEFKINASGKEHEPAYILYIITFYENKDIKLTGAKLTAFDKLVYIAAATLWKEQGEIFTLKQLYKAIGNTGNAGAYDLKRLRKSLEKMGNAEITVDNGDEAGKQKKRTVFKYSGKLLPYEIVEAVVDGNLTDAAIHLFREPPLISFARERGQITTIPIKMLQTPSNKTEDKTAIDEYIINRISWNKADSCKITFDKLFEHCGITDKKKKQRAKEQTKTTLSYYKEQNFISDFSETKDGYIFKK